MPIHSPGRMSARGRKPMIEHPPQYCNFATPRSRTQFARLGQQLHNFRHRIAEDDPAGPRGSLRSRAEGIPGMVNERGVTAREEESVDVAAWLHGLGLQRYEQAFRDNEIDARVL